MRVLAFGEILWDVIEGKYHIGGAPLNFAAHVVKCGQDSSIISCLGKDELGIRAFEKVEDFKVDSSFIQSNDIRTGFVPVNIVNGQPEYEIVQDVAYDFIKSDLIDHSKIRGFNTFYFGSLIQRSQLSKDSLYSILEKNSFDDIFYDVNLRKDSYSKEVILNSLEYCTTFKVNDEEVRVLSELLFDENLDFIHFCQRISKSYPSIIAILITAGQLGCYVYSNDMLEHVPSEPITVVDTVGAGDSFSAAYMCKYSKSKDPIESAKVANKVGGFVASSEGPIPEYPDYLKSEFL